jgi:hypothetical protein
MYNSISINNIQSYSSTPVKKKDEDFLNKMKPHNFISLNEIDVCNQIKKIPYYSNFFYVFYNYDFITVGEYDNKLEIITNNNPRVLLFTYKANVNIPFYSYFFHLTTPKCFFYNILFTYSYLLNSVEKLQKMHVCFFQISAENILFQSYSQIPFLSYFHNSIHIKKLTIDYVKEIIDNTLNFTHKPLEVYVIFYLIKNNLTTLSNSLIQKIVNFYISNCSFFDFFSQDYKNNYKDKVYLLLKKYINMSKNDIIMDLLKYIHTWDTFSLSSLYLYIICCFYKVYKPYIHKYTLFINNFIHLLSDNIHPDPLKRNNIESTIQNYNVFFNQTSTKMEWSFIHDLPVENMRDVFQMLSK